MGRIWNVLTRKKAIDPATAEETRLNRVLNCFDLTALGVGSTLGVGVYVLAGQVAKTTAGPAVVLSFLIAAIASVFAGLCYAEFGARAPRAGSAYIYSYVCVGEFVAFVIGWNLILEYIIGSASVARGLSLYLDTLLNNTLQDTFREIAPINVAYLAPYFDFFSFGISILLAVGLAFGLKESSMANNIVTVLNVGVVIFIIIAGSLKANAANWHVTPNSTNATNSTNIGAGGFFPFGVEGMIKGAATCFYGFVGFDCIATTGEEVKNPRRAIPISIVVCLFVVFLAYFGVATVLTLMVPYYLQDYNAPIPRAFEMMDWEVAKWIVAIGAIFGLCASLFGAMFPLPRIIYAMGSDGLVFKFLAKVHPRFQTPLIGTLLAGVLTGTMSALFDLSQLINMMSIGTLQAYTIVAASVLLLRYKEEVKKIYSPIKTSSDTDSVSSESSVDSKYNDDGLRQNFDGPTTSEEQELVGGSSTGDGSNKFLRCLKCVINCRLKEPTRLTENIVAIEVFLYCLLCIGIGLCAIYLRANLANKETWAIAVASTIVGLTVLVLMSLTTQPKSKKELSFKVPLVPLIPALSILANIYLMLMLDYMTWIRFAVWMAIGIPMYCLCACSDRNGNGNYASNIVTNGHSKLVNGLSNPAFVLGESNGQARVQITTIKKKAAPPPPPPPPTIFEQKEQFEVQQEAVIAQLDEILEKEAAIAQLDDVLENETFRINDRKLSAGTSSDLSVVVASRSENTVADVHCADIVTPVADPQSSPFLFDRSNSPHLTVASVKDDDLDNPEAKPERVVSIDESNDSVSPEISLPVVLLDRMNDPKGDEVQSTVLQVELSQSPSNAPSKVTASSEDTNPKTGEDATVSDIKIEPSEVQIETETPQAASENWPSSVPTKEALKSVTLRHVQEQIKKFEPTNKSASDDNLKFGSDEYKNFIKTLDNKLKKSSPLPAYFIVPKTALVAEPKSPREPNENVIDIPIDRVGAKENLKKFYDARNNPSTPPLEHKPSLYAGQQKESGVSNRDFEGRPILHTSKSLDSTTLKSQPVEDSVSSSQKPERTINDAPDLDRHRSRMENVFRSIKLNKTDKEDDDDDQLKHKLSKSLGSSFGKDTDKTNHQDKMDNIFKSIKAMRKDSFKGVEKK